MSKNKEFHKKPFEEATKLKLEIFRECFREWFPFFIHNPFVEKIYIYDFFAGPGVDNEGNFGSPLILLDEAKGEECKNCNSVKAKPIIFAFNDKIQSKELEKNVIDYINNCKSKHCNQTDCVYKPAFGNFEFKEAFDGQNFKSILHNAKNAKFILLDQFGFSQVDETVFKELVNAPQTDFIFFISSSFINRFKEHDNTKKYFDTSKIDFSNSPPNKQHKLIAQYFSQLIENKEYYLHHFSIRKGSNYYGLIFGSNHTLGMEKFLKVCWKKDELSGESSQKEDYNNDFGKDELFYGLEQSSKKISVLKELTNLILSGEIRDNIAGFKWIMKQGCMPNLFTEKVKELEKNDKIVRTGELNYTSTNIHKAKKYQIEVKEK